MDCEEARAANTHHALVSNDRTLLSYAQASVGVGVGPTTK